ncbi:heparan sulfate glucosamine 3-O-sulfotransferase 5-like [Melanaphis sacchari]|uniref:Heparan sulfate glucosamine 3-O-sulfotransferase 5 n=1 Tax=Melanaphis sacchari TaxID=742174 RepID=A0A2H8TGZ3_9HEMI|nr:heparan sulfate glucosamine 3-O-sulfotransferase 5-like [Melanaphis sacchari]
MRRWCVPNVQWSQLVLCVTVLFLLGGLHIYRGPNGGALQTLDEVVDDEDMSGSTRTTQDDRAYRRLRFPKTSRRLPQAIIIGVRKGGTRALLEMLFLHKSVQKANGEVHFFDRDENYERGLDWYRKRMPYSFPNQITIEKSPSYFVTPEVPERIKAMNSSIKLLLILRDPVIRAISDYTQLHSNPLANRSSRSFEQLVVKSDGTVNTNYRPVAVSTYHNHVYRWLDVFPRDQLFVVNGDRLITNPVSELNRIETFLGLEHRIGADNFYFNRTKGFYCLRYGPVDKCLKETKGRKHPEIQPAVVSKLREHFSQHNQKLYDVLGQDFGWPEK